MTDARRRLEAERDQALHRLDLLAQQFEGVVAAARDSNADDEHDPEGATIAYERSQLDALISAARRSLSEIDAAITRLDDGTYGACERCGEPIAAGRLEARPLARRCISCAARS
jgi:DnaK suppressor protein